ncbi:MAG: hypothetical protein HZC42_04550 [Candidatus Eisenbacteria bacterium]|nr:hypothetical protein [Candidatus Eisenbacteria bacterium]
MRLGSGAVVAALLALAPAAAGAAGRLESVGGHLAVGYAKLFTAEAPGGSLSLAGGLDYPLSATLRAGVDIGYHLLGSRIVERGSLFASVDYSLFETEALVHWQPRSLGPVARLSAGPALLAANGTLSTAGGGAGFSDLAVDELAGGFALGATLMSRRPTPVRLGLDLGARVAFLSRRHETWTLAIARVAVHY